MATTLPLRGLMLDAARLVESIEYDRRFIDFCAEWDVNAIVFRLTDDQGCAMRFRSHPELRMHANALDPEQVRELAEYGQQRGVELIPEIESFGHTRYITDVPEHADLSDKVLPTDWREGIIPLHPKTLGIFKDLYEEAAPLFPGRFLHAGCDEVSWGKSPFSRTLLETKSEAEVWGGHLNALYAIAEGLGKQMIVWGDMVLRKTPQILDHLDRRIIIHDWDYWTTETSVLHKWASHAVSKGFRVIGGPALIYANWGPRAGAGQPRNIDAYVEAYRALPADAAVGVLLTNWIPSRYLQNAIWDGLAYAAVAMKDGAASAQREAWPRFVERHFGCPWNSAWEEAFQLLYAVAPARGNCGPEIPRLFAPWSDDAQLRKVLEAGDAPSVPIDQLQKALEACALEVVKNQQDFEALVLTADYLAQLRRRDDRAREAARADDFSSTARILRTLAQEDRTLCDRLVADWNNTGRPLASLGKGPHVSGLVAEDRLAGCFVEASDYSTELAANPARFRELAQA